MSRLGNIIHHVIDIDWASVETELKHMIEEAKNIGQEAIHEYGDLKKLLATLMTTKHYVEKLTPRKNLEVQEDFLNKIDKQELEYLKLSPELLKKIAPLLK